MSTERIAELERLREITEEDAEVEGFHPYGCGGEGNVCTFKRALDAAIDAAMKD